MQEQYFYKSNKMSAPLEYMLHDCNTFEEFEARYSDEFLNKDCQIGQYLNQLLNKYDKRHSSVSNEAHLHQSYVGNIVNGKKNNPSRNALICICFALGATEEELQYLLKYAGHAPLYVRRKRDVIIWFGIMKHEDLDAVNENLLERGLTPLYTE